MKTTSSSTQRLRGLGAILATLLVTSRAAANPVVDPTIPLLALGVLLPLLFAGEIALTIALLKLSRSLWPRAIVASAGIQFFSYSLLLWVLHGIGSLVPFPVAVTLGEIAVTLFEAVAYWLYLRGHREPRGIVQCLIASAAGNLFSYIGGAAAGCTLKFL